MISELANTKLSKLTKTKISELVNTKISELVNTIHIVYEFTFYDPGFIGSVNEYKTYRFMCTGFDCHGDILLVCSRSQLRF